MSNINCTNFAYTFVHILLSKLKFKKMHYRITLRDDAARGEHLKKTRFAMSGFNMAKRSISKGDLLY